ncbi:MULTISPECIES: hypothetical protein [Methylosinus]|uniref:Sulfotransferase family protein n=1 Tax=Methylosinus trichosporium (strain ATCC 35070 / NCIMB 11131 / UNIQEM 75 / OB3b) TaxID=595536 RepID=A0A2D2CZK3_METT3|nr:MULTISPECIES: hypothetical protein [Methylosinus]ATQ68167.1 hypothetical protein CQW49_09975 [Methylosinus trichosporium OB3b]OBS53433.1 hypothetical protein A8B73_05790 [Methylosinus sp. 3S-1]
MRKQIIFHIGLEKTGTSALQRFCHAHRRALAARGVLYPTRNLAFSRQSRNHAALVAGYYEDTGWADYHLTRSWKTCRRVVASLVDEIERDSAPTALVSAEHLSSRLYPFQIERLAEDFKGFDCRIVLVLRPHEERVYSAYSSTIRAGRGLTLDAFVDELLLPANWYCRYAETIARWRNVLGAERLTILPFHKTRDIVDLLWTDMLGLDGAPPRRGERINADPGASALEAMRRVNEIIGDREAFPRRGYARHLLLTLARAAILRSLAKTPRRADDRLRVEGERRARLAALVDEDIAQLAALTSVELPRMGDVADADRAAAAVIEERATRLLKERRLVAASLALAKRFAQL